MWKYIVTYFIVIFYPLSDDFKDGVVSQSVKDKIEFKTRKQATDFITKTLKSNKCDILTFVGIKLDSAYTHLKDTCLHIMVSKTMLACDPPIEDCNTATCMKCGKTWPTY